MASIISTFPFANTISNYHHRTNTDCRGLPQVSHKEMNVNTEIFPGRDLHQHKFALQGNLKKRHFSMSEYLITALFCKLCSLPVFSGRHANFICRRFRFTLNSLSRRSTRRTGFFIKRQDFLCNLTTVRIRRYFLSGPVGLRWQIDSKVQKRDNPQSFSS